MNATNITLGLSSAVLPLAVAANAVPIPEGMNPLLVMLFAALGPTCVGFLHLFGKTVYLSLSGYFSARAEAKKELGTKLLADKDKSNDALGNKLLLDARAELGLAKVLEHAALKVKE